MCSRPSSTLGMVYYTTEFGSCQFLLSSTFVSPRVNGSDLYLQRVGDLLHKLLVQHSAHSVLKLCFINRGDLLSQRNAGLCKPGDGAPMQHHMRRHVHGLVPGCDGHNSDDRRVDIGSVVADNEHGPKPGLAAAGGHSPIRLVNIPSPAHLIPPLPAYKPLFPDRASCTSLPARSWPACASDIPWCG